MSSLFPKLVLASSSPRRAELLQQLGLSFDVVVAGVDERHLADESPRDYVARVASAKVTKVKESIPDRETVVIAADTSIILAGGVLGKPKDAADFERTLSALGGVEHTVLSAVVVASGCVPLACRVAETRVWMRETTRLERAAYWETGEPVDKAGGYAIQGVGAQFIERIEGNYSTVVGLPIFELSTLLALHGIDLLKMPRDKT